MRHFIHIATTYVIAHKKEVTVSLILLTSALIMTALFIYNNPQKVIYQPTNACDLLTPAKAQDLLGDRVISIDTKGAVVSGDIAISKCSYTDENHDKNQMMVAAVAVRSGVNDTGVQQNKTEFEASKAHKTVENVKDLGESAYFNPTLGQLNILEGRRWIIVNYGVGAAPETNTVDKAIELAHTILH